MCVLPSTKTILKVHCVILCCLFLCMCISCIVVKSGEVCSSVHPRDLQSLSLCEGTYNIIEVSFTNDRGKSGVTLACGGGARMISP
jgi:hypothetical protein